MLRRKKSIYLIIAVVIAGIFAIGMKSLYGGIKKNTSVSAANVNKVSVKVTKAETSTIASDASFKATLEASEEGTVSNKTGGKVVEVSFENGQIVSAGQTLARIDDTDIKNSIKSSEAQLASSQAQLQATQSTYNATLIGLSKPQSNLENAQRSYDRTKALFDQGACSKVDFENVETALKTAQTDLETAKANAEASRLSIETQKANIQASQTSLNTLMDSLKNTAITAPIGGIMDGKNVTVGQFVNVGTVLGKVKNISPIYAVIDVKESDLSYLKIGTNAKFKLNGSDSTEYDGVVKNIDGAADATSRTFKCKIEFDNKDGKLKPGVFGNIKIATDENKRSIALPLKALVGSEGNYYVFINNNGIAKKQNVTTGEILKDTVEVKSGVKDGDSVICTNVGTLQDGDAVKVVTE